MWLYRILDTVFPSSFAAKLIFVACCAGLVPPLVTGLYLYANFGSAGLASPALFLSIVAGSLSVSVNIMGLQALMQPLRDLSRTLGTMQARRTYRPLPNSHVDDVGQAMSATNRLAESLGVRLDPSLVKGAIDPLTGILTPEGLEHALREVEAGSVLAIAIDNVHAITDTHGQAATDRLMATVGRVLRETTRKGDVLGVRAEGAFCVYLRGAGREVARHVAERIRSRVLAEDAAALTDAALSLGLAVRAAEEHTDPLWLRALDAMKEAQTDGCDRVILARTAEA